MVTLKQGHRTKELIEKEGWEPLAFKTAVMGGPTYFKRTRGGQEEYLILRPDGTEEITDKDPTK